MPLFKKLFVVMIINENKTKKSSLVSGNRRGENFFYHSPARTVECVSKYIFQKTNKQTKKKKAKETKEEKRISLEN